MISKNAVTSDEVFEDELDDNDVALPLPLSKEDRDKRDKITIYNTLDENNPYRNSSKLHLGKMWAESWRWIETDVLLALIQSRLSSAEMSVFLYTFHLQGVLLDILNPRSRCMLKYMTCTLRK